jgi:tRNA pseudouridine55 synthase
MDKTYEGTVCLGRTSKTFDGEGVDFDAPAAELPDLTADKLRAVLAEFEGKIIQQVPAFSAVRVDGQRLYELAREGAEVEPPEREVIIRSLHLKAFDSPCLSLEVTCTKGTYIRSLAHDIGQKLGCGAYLSQLRRTSVGHLSVERAVTLDELAALIEGRKLDERLLQLHEALGYSALLVDNGFRESVINGREVRASNVASIEGSFAAGDTILLKDSRGLALAVGVAEIDSGRVTRMCDEGKLFKYVRVLN